MKNNRIWHHARGLARRSWVYPLSLFARCGGSLTGRAILLIGYPRCGSSWVGHLLGSAANAMYLREPITQSILRTRKRYMFAAGPEFVSQEYDRISRRAFSGVPDFSSKIVEDYRQWRPFAGKDKRLVIKEVNLHALSYFVDAFNPRVLFLLRHPAAIANSCCKLGWIKEDWEDPWYLSGINQGYAIRRGLDACNASPDAMIVHYEDLVQGGVETWENLFNQLDLHFDDKVLGELHATMHSTKDENQKHGFAIHRDSARMLGAWRNEITEQDAARVRAGYSAYAIPYYTKDEDWELTSCEPRIANRILPLTGTCGSGDPWQTRSNNRAAASAQPQR